MLLALILQAAASAVPVSTEPPAAPLRAAVVASAAKPETVDSDKKICKYESVTGSRVGGLRICMTKAQWDARSTEMVDSLLQFQIVNRTTPIPDPPR